jgi:hypothetical protein
MPTVSGHIGETIPFEVQSAGTVTGVFYGAGKASHEILNLNFLNARIPNDANWGYVNFHKRDTTAVYDGVGTGHLETGALSDLTSNLISSGLIGACTSGVVSYSNLWGASGVCNLSATGISKDLASGKLYNAYGSGLCGDDVDYENRGYSTNTTRLVDFNTFVDSAGVWLAVGKVEDTGNFVYKKAQADVSCVTKNVEATDYKFVPIPQVSFFTPLEGSAGDPLLIHGRAFSGVSNVSISGVNAPFVVKNNFLISGTIPQGVFDNKINLAAPSGVVVESTENLKTFAGRFTPVTQRVLDLADGQSLKRARGTTEKARIFGQNISGLQTGYLTNESNQKIDLLSDPSFFYTGSYLDIPISGLDEGYYDVAVSGSKPEDVDSINNAIYIVDGPIIQYGYSRVLSTGLIVETSLYDSREAVYNDLKNKKYTFSLNQDVNKVCLTFNSSNIISGSGTYELEKYLGSNKTTQARYYIEGTGVSSGISHSAAMEKYNKGEYTIDEYNDPYGPYSYKLGCNCSIINTFTEDQGTTTTYPDIKLSASGYTTGENAADILQQLTSHAGYQISSYTHEGPILAREGPFNYPSGINWPYSTSLINDHSSYPWENILHSGINHLSGLDSGGVSNMTSGYLVQNSSSTITTGSISATGKNENEARTLVEDIMNQQYSQCSTGNYSKQTTNHTVDLSRTGYFWGYC